MTYRELYKQTEDILASSFEAGQLFTHATNKRVMHLPFLGEKDAPEKDAELLFKLCERRKQGEPLQYLLGEWEFYSLPFKVGKGVLIPRADTETLVDAALDKIRETPAPEVLDLCSGTGCVAIALSHERPDARVTALELSDQAYVYLRRNITINNSTVEGLRGDLREYTHPRPLDLLVSNPPYIPRETIATLQKEVLHEPRRALDGGVDGLDFYRAIVRLYRPQLKPGGWICLEVGIGQSEQVARILAEHGFTEIKARLDLGGVERVVSAKKGNL
jgi:release factor glutamine methyltransferase